MATLVMPATSVSFPSLRAKKRISALHKSREISCKENYVPAAEAENVQRE
jgi:hypothetical protein